MGGQQDFRRWIEAESDGQLDQADALFTAVFRAAPAIPPPTSAFTAQVMTAVVAAANRDARRSQLVRRVGMPAAAVCAITLGYASSGLILSVFSAILVGALDLFIGSVVYVATTMRSGGDVWTLAGNLGRAAAALLASPAVTTTILAMQGMAIAALLGLQRLLRSERESQPFR